MKTTKYNDTVEFQNTARRGFLLFPVVFSGENNISEVANCTWPCLKNGTKTRWPPEIKLWQIISGSHCRLKMYWPIITKICAEDCVGIATTLLVLSRSDKEFHFCICITSCTPGWLDYFFVLGVLPITYSQNACTDFHAIHRIRCRLAQGCAFSELQKQNLKFRLHFPQKITGADFELRPKTT